MKYYILAGEASGDLHAANLVKALREQDTQAQFRGFGGKRMQAEGVQLDRHIDQLAFMGFTEVLLHLRKISANFKTAKQSISNFQPDVVICIDYPGFNLRMLPFIKSLGIRTVYYISPQLWAWKAGRVKTIKQYVDHMLVILPFEKAFYEGYDYQVEYVGHPLLDEISDMDAEPDFLPKNCLPDGSLVALLPGSRKQELKRSMPVLLEVANERADLQFVIAGAPSLDAAAYASFDLPANVHLVHGQTYALLQHVKAALVTSGTATLETALFGVPQVVCYRGSTLSYWIARRLVKVRFISLVNLIMNSELVPERIQSSFNRRQLLRDLDDLLQPEKAAIMQKGYMELRLKLGGQGASSRAAAIITDALHKAL
ncbi:MAG TPA: lipid-A-disaccharide synthase [Chitinophagales bacterium]|nr:lipid-A-disaccharide synthase [Chitinophagales bacterium]